MLPFSFSIFCLNQYIFKEEVQRFYIKRSNVFVFVFIQMEHALAMSVTVLPVISKVKATCAVHVSNFPICILILGKICAYSEIYLSAEQV